MPTDEPAQEEHSQPPSLPLAVPIPPLAQAQHQPEANVPPEQTEPPPEA